MKAFDSVSNRSLWNALEQCEMQPLFGGLLKRLYERQKGSVLTDNESDVVGKRRERNSATCCPAYSSTQCFK